MAQIKMEQDAYIRGIMRKKNDVVEVSSAEERQFVSNGTASDVSDNPKKTATKDVKKAPKKKAK